MMASKKFSDLQFLSRPRCRSRSNKLIIFQTLLSEVTVARLDAQQAGFQKSLEIVCLQNYPIPEANEPWL